MIETRILTSDELAELLNVTKRTFKSYITRGTLEQKIKNIGWHIVEKGKDGRTMLYAIEPYQELTLEDIVSRLNIREEENFERYSKLRTTKEGLVMSKSDVSRETGIERNTVRNWDGKLEEAEVIKKDGVVYRATRAGKVWEITKEEYDDYWTIEIVAKITISNLKRDYKRGLIALKTYESGRDKIMERLLDDRGYHVHKFEVYAEAEFFEKFVESLYK